MTTDAFWTHIDHQLTRLATARTVDEVLAICPAMPGTSTGHGFFAGSGGDGTVLDALSAAGWGCVDYRAHYHWAAMSPTGELLSYVEGDLYRGNQLTDEAG